MHCLNLVHCLVKKIALRLHRFPFFLSNKTIKFDVFVMCNQAFIPDDSDNYLVVDFVD